MRWIKIRTFLCTLGVIGSIFIVIQLYLIPVEEGASNTIGDEAVILWWTPFGSEETFRKCGSIGCRFTQKRQFFNQPNLKAILFYGSNFEIGDLPVPRGGERWALLHEESPKNNLIFVHEEALKLFNYSSTFSRHSDVPLTLVDLSSEENLRDKKYFLKTAEKNILIEEKNLSPVLYLQSNCDTVSERDLYISELMKYIAVDSYGDCLNNRPLPEILRSNYVDKLSSEELMRFVGQYKFTLAFENAVCDDYITEKLWRPLIVGSVPIYYGSPTFKDWLPSNRSAIAVRDFETPEQLADFVQRLASNDAEYEQYLSHKLLKNGITNDKLLAGLRKRPRSLDSVFEYYLRSFECLVCEKVQDKKPSTVSKKEYSCEKPNKKFHFDKSPRNNWWADMWDIEKCSAKLLAQYVSRNESFQIDEFNTKAMEISKNNQC